MTTPPTSTADVKFRAVVAIALKDLRQLTRDRAGAFFTLIFPLAIAVFFGMVFGGGGGGSAMEIAVVNEDGGAAAAALVEDLKADSSLKVTVTADRAAGQNLVQGDVAACIVVPKGFDPGSMFSGSPMLIEGYVDPRRTAEAGLLTGKLNELAFRQLSKVFGDTARLTSSLDKARGSIAAAEGLAPAEKLLFGAFFDSVKNLNSRMNERPATGTDDKTADGSGGFGFRPVDVKLEKLQQEDRARPASSYEISFPQGVVWGLMGCILGGAVGLSEERSRGTLMRLAAGPITPGVILAGKALGCFIMCVIVQTLLLAFGMIVFGMKVHQPVMMLAVVILASFGFTGLMMLMAGLARTEAAASGMGRALVLVLAMIGGGSIPIFFMPPIMQTISNVSPFKWATLAIEGAMWRRFSPADMALPAGILVAAGVIGFLVGASALRRAGST